MYCCSHLGLTTQLDGILDNYTIAQTYRCCSTRIHVGTRKLLGCLSAPELQLTSLRNFSSSEVLALSLPNYPPLISPATEPEIETETWARAELRKLCASLLSSGLNVEANGGGEESVAQFARNASNGLEV